MNNFLKKALALSTAVLALAGTARADKGMWLLNELTQENMQQMKDLGFRLSSEELYSLDKPSVAGSVIIFGRGCTGVTVSATGLIMTNHHCGYGAIQSQSTVDHDYLRDGFVSQTYAQELPIEGLEVRYLVDIKDITSDILARLKKNRKVKTEIDRINAINAITADLRKAEEARLGNPMKEVIIRSYYAGNKYYMITYDVFRDVRMVFAPPSSIGKYGGDTDNWMWTRHTGDFSVFRVYANADNKPANYSKDNVPYRPQHFASVSTEGYREGDFAMTIGFPGSTERYIPSWGIENRMENQNQALIDVRGVKQEIWRKAMDADQAVRIKYSDKYAGSSNYWKNSIGMNRGLRRLAVVDRKREEEAAFGQWAATRKEYAGVLTDLEKNYKDAGSLIRRQSYLRETLLRGTEIFAIASAMTNPAVTDEDVKEVYKDYVASLDREVLPAMLDIARKELTASDVQKLFAVIDSQFGGSTKAFADYVFDNSAFVSEEGALRARKDKDVLASDPALTYFATVQALYTEITEALKGYQSAIGRGNRLYFAGRQAMDPKRQMPSDANFTMRMSYGSVLGYSPSDGVKYSYYTTPAGIMEKYQPGSTEFDLKPEFIDLIEGKAWGRWADKKDGQMYVNFLSNNDITGGNSGSPVFDKNGRVIGLAFDGNWEAMSGDIEFEPALQRTISVDIRYVLFVIEQWGKCPRLIEELDLR